MDYTGFNTGPGPELSFPLSEEELDDLWISCVLEFGHLDIPETQRDVISAREHLPSDRTNHLSFDDPNDTALTLAHTIPMGKLTDSTTLSRYMGPDVLGGWPLPAQPPIDTNFAAPDMQICDSPWTRMAPFTTHSMAATHSLDPGPSSFVNPAPSPEEPTSLLESGPGGSSETGQDMSEYGVNLTELIALLRPTSYPVASSITTTTGNGKVVQATTPMSDVAHGKRRRDAEGSYDNEVPVVDVMPPHKRVRGGLRKGDLEAPWSEARTHRTVETRVRTKSNEISKEAGRGAEGLATPKVQGVYHCSLLGPSFQQGWVVTTAQGQEFPGVEGRETSHHMASTEQQEEGHLFEIPSDFEGFNILLAATEADWTRGAVDQIKCRLCPNSGFSKWEDFKRHCRTTEAHPLQILFCEHCGDFFARSDSLRRHLKRPPAECLDMTPEKAEEKRRDTEREHSDFIGRVERNLTTGEEIGTPFARIIKQRYPKSSKKRTGSGWE